MVRATVPRAERATVRAAEALGNLAAKGECVAHESVVEPLSTMWIERMQDLLDLGVAPGPRVGEVLKRVETWWADGGYSADRGACLDLARRIIGGDHPT